MKKTTQNLRKVVFCLSLVIVLFYSSEMFAQDLWKTNPTECIILNDTLNVKMTLVTLLPGASLAPHTHSTFLAYFIDGGVIESTPKNGSPARLELSSGLHMQSPPMGIHSDKNVGSTTVKFLLIELKDPKRK